MGEVTAGQVRGRCVSLQPPAQSAAPGRPQGRSQSRAGRRGSGWLSGSSRPPGAGPEGSRGWSKAVRPGPRTARSRVTLLRFENPLRVTPSQNRRPSFSNRPAGCYTLIQGNLVVAKLIQLVVKK